MYLLPLLKFIRIKSRSLFNVQQVFKSLLILNSILKKIYKEKKIFHPQSLPYANKYYGWDGIQHDTDVVFDFTNRCYFYD